MLRILKKPSAIAAKIGGSDCGPVDDDLTAWELVEASLSDDEDTYSFDGDGGGVIRGETEPPLIKIEEKLPNESAIATEDLVPVPPPSIDRRDASFDCNPAYRYENADDFNNELIRCDVEKKLGKGRMMKTGKKGGQKYSTTKRPPCYYKVRPGSEPITW